MINPNIKLQSKVVYYSNFHHIFKQFSNISMSSLTPRSKTQSIDQNEFPAMISLKITNKLDLGDVKKVDRSIHSDQDSQTSFEKQQLLELQIKQLKRENNFLKKKLQQLNDQIQKDSNSHHFSKQNTKSKKTNLNKPKNAEDKSDCLQKSLQLFYEEVSNLISSVAELYKIKSDKTLQLHLINTNKAQFDAKKSSTAWPLNQNSSRDRSDLLRKQVLNKRLERVGLQPQQKKYGILLELFMEYYQCKSQHQNKAISYIDQMTEKAMQINRDILQRGQSRRLIKQSQFTNSQTFDIAQNMSIQNIKKKQFMQSLQKIQGIENLAQELQFDDYQFSIKP